ncbi:hypothetical protein N7520_002432 [Penicillium odoratum]|uniref:uncharacterized protein n=1 Tax=Penicillium odoratum TaxID=1167516 RepID=UPI0025496896|nr:uncharacterized protein N7520_002432 [Penicillium odoratum]KAJ5771903.1 hypothetical protein N7520_002432 [Penicillium odoratum]
MPSLETEELDIIAPVEDSQVSTNRGKDQVACFLASVENGDDNRCFTVEDEKQVLRRIDLRVLPVLLGAYFFQQLDKSALSYTSILGLAEDAHLVGSQYSWLSSILYLSQLVFQPLAAFLLVKAPTGKVISTAIFLWGTPSCIAATQMWWRRGEQSLRAAMWNSMNGLTFIKFIAVERLRANQMGIVSREWRWDHVLETLYDIKTWSWFLLIMSISISSGGIGSFGNLILGSSGYTTFESILFNLPFGAIQIIAILGGAIGTILMLVIPRSNKGVLLFGYYLVSTMAAITPMIYAWEAQNTAGDTKRKCTSAAVLVGMCTGNVIGPQLYSRSQAPAYRPGLIANLAMFILVAVLSIFTDIYLIAINKKHAKKREALGRSANTVDESMLTKDKMETSKALELEDVRDIHNGNVVDKGFADTTDLRNEDFIYVY